MTSETAGSAPDLIDWSSPPEEPVPRPISIRMSKGNPFRSEEKVLQKKTEVFRTAKLVQQVPIALFQPEEEVRPFYTPATQISKAPFQSNASISGNRRYPSYFNSDDQLDYYPAFNPVQTISSAPTTLNYVDSRNSSAPYHAQTKDQLLPAQVSSQINNQMSKPPMTERPERSYPEPSKTQPQTPPPPPAPPQQNLAVSTSKKPVQAAGGKADLLEEIRRRGGVEGAGLHKVSDAAVDSCPRDKDDLFGALHHALNVIQHANRMSDDSDSDIESNGSWSEEDC